MTRGLSSALNTLEHGLKHLLIVRATWGFEHYLEHQCHYTLVHRWHVSKPLAFSHETSSSSSMRSSRRQKRHDKGLFRRLLKRNNHDFLTNELCLKNTAINAKSFVHSRHVSFIVCRTALRFPTRDSDQTADRTKTKKGYRIRI